MTKRSDQNKQATAEELVRITGKTSVALRREDIATAQSAIGTLTARLGGFTERLNLQKRAGQAKRGTQGPLRVVVERACAFLGPNPSLASVLGVLTNDGPIDDWYEALHDPIDLHCFEINEETRTLDYDNRNGEKRSASLKTVENYIANFRRSQPQ